ncbi:Alpha/beta hydrolase fold-1 [Apiospora marii]|uniref:Alpha/beta hydrolase fold-1 n=1 Tax=Apiospora marii TaxID=335849 RepID=UPI003131F4A0
MAATPSPSPSSSPVIVLVHGAFHPPVFYQPLVAALQAAPHSYTVLAPALPSTGSDDSVAGKTYVDDVQRIHADLLPLLDAGRQAVLVCHSHGGVAGSAAAENQTVVDRNTRGLPGGVKAVVYISAFALAEQGMSVIKFIGGEEAAKDLYYPEGPHYKLAEGAGDKFYNFLPKVKRDEMGRWLVHQSKASKNVPAHFVAADVTVPKTYVVCTKDNVFPVPAQKALAQASDCKIVEIESDHSPFWSDGPRRQLLQVISSVVQA